MLQIQASTLKILFICEVTFKMVVSSGKASDAAERSLAVHYANYKEDIVLKKNLDILNRTEKNIVHSVQIDQKILYKRFQDKLHRSKLAYARMYGDKEKERELRAKNLRSLNINVGDSEQDYEFLKKIQPNKGTKPKKTSRVKINIDAVIDDVFDEEAPRLRSRSMSEGSMTPLPVTTHAHPITTRPSSAKYGRNDQRTQCFPVTALSAKGNTPDKNLLKVPTIDTRPRTCSPKLSGPRSRRNSSVTTKNGNKSPRRSTNLFEHDEHVDHVEMRLRELKTLDFTDKIGNFCESLEDYKSDKNGNIDYYTMRVEASPKVQNLIDIPGTPDEQYQKHFGNLTVKSLTMKKLNFDFSKSDSSQSHLFTPDASAMLRYESSEDSDSDSD
ncbi:uncharacterized protein LOC143043255 [Mytilus galloprovincialis]|uniref:uncharacterized protein LOC143043255 n=1 Tax=Mytilus galloprovincialis TaxID=29158 RepID=UPI003F7CD0D0